jgi:hypothetical protein
MMNVFLAYAAVEDDDFVSYIKMKKNQWEEGSFTLTLAGLLLNAENHYKMRIQQESWMARSKKDEEITALKALLNNKEGENGNKSNNGTKKKTGEERLKEDKEKNPWKYVPPRDNEPKSKHVNNAIWHWCTKHNRWKGHTDATCHGVGVFVLRGTNTQLCNYGKNVSFKADVNHEEEEENKPSLQVKQSLMSIMSGHSELFD